MKQKKVVRSYVRGIKKDVYGSYASLVPGSSKSADKRTKRNKAAKASRRRNRK